jgi:nucleoid-associated protein YgaU
VVALALAAVAMPVAGAMAAPEAIDRVERTRYVVRPGDTLWSIAERAAPGHDRRAVVDAIAEANGVDAASLFPGRTLVVPAG